MMKKKKAKPRRKTSCAPPAHFPKGWNQRRADEVAKYYGNQSDEEAIAEMEAAYMDGAFAMMAISRKLFSEVTKLLAKRAG
jgi:hypothetical protein